MDFKEQYKHPKWQKRRIDYMNQLIESNDLHNPICEWCQSDEKQLHLHHIQYKNDFKIWEYEDDELILLCSDCHSEIHKINEEIKSYLNEASKCNEVFLSIYEVLYLMNNMNICLIHVPDLILNSLKFAGNYEVIKKFEKKFRNNK